MKTVGRRETMAIAVITMIAVLAAGWLMLVKPASAKVKSLKAQAATQEQNNTALSTQISVLEQERKQLPREQAEVAALAQRVPASAELPNLLRQMQQAAKDTGVKLNGITPTQPGPLTGATGIEAVGVSLSVSGGYAEIDQFDSALESLSRAFLVSGFTLTSGSATAGTAGASSSSAPTVSATILGRVLLRTPAATTTTAG